MLVGVVRATVAGLVVLGRWCDVWGTDWWSLGEWWLEGGVGGRWSVEWSGLRGLGLVGGEEL